MVVLLRYMQTALPQGTLHWRVLAVYHDMVVDVDAVIDPVASGLAVGALDYKLVQHMLNDLRHWPQVSRRLDIVSTCRACLATISLRRPSMLETVVAEVVLARKLDGLIERRMADQTDEVAVGRRHIFEGRELGRDFDDSAAATLRRW
jgi:hypothetical protein